MTGAEFGSRYKLLKQVTHEGTITHHALDSADHVVMAHFLGPAASAAGRQVLEQLQRIAPVDRQRVIEQQEVDGDLVVVTQFIQGFDSLEHWLSRRAPTPSIPDNEAQPAPERPSAPGEFTRLFSAVDLGTAGVPPIDRSQSQERVAPPERPVDPAFTQIFAAGGSPVTPQPTPPAKAPEETSPAKTGKPVVRWRDAAPPESPPRSAESKKPAVRWKQEDSHEAVTPASPPGENTRLFGAAGLTGSTSGSLEERPGRNEPRAPDQPRPGEFTQLFQPNTPASARGPTPAPPGPPDLEQALSGRSADVAFPLPQSRPSEPGDFTRIMAGLDAAPPSDTGGFGPAGPPSPGPAAQTASTPPAPSEPGAFTRIVAGISSAPQAPAASSRTPAAPPPPAERRPGGSPSRLVVFVLIGVGVLTALMLVLYFSLR